MKHAIILMLATCSLLAAGSPEPQITLRVVGADAYVTIVSTVPWTLYQSGDCKTWWRLQSGKPAVAGAVQIFQGVDKGWVVRSRMSFYKVVKSPSKAIY